MTWSDFMRRVHEGPGLPSEVLADLRKAEEGLMLADPTCSICVNWNDGDPACPKHGGTYQEGMICPTGNAGHIVIVCQRGAAYVCFTCEEG